MDNVTPATPDALASSFDALDKELIIWSLSLGIGLIVFGLLLLAPRVMANAAAHVSERAKGGAA